nr:isocitrate dehydrogenase (NAD(+)) [Chloroherpeton thalassium]
MAQHKITLLPGDGIGPEITSAVLKIIKATGVSIEWEKFHAGKTAIEKFGEPLPRAILDSIKANKVALKAPITTEVGKGFKSVNVQLRKALGLYANLRPTKSIEGIRSRYTDIDLIIVRENTESLYTGIENEITPGVVQALKVITRTASLRIAHFAFETARQRGRKKVTAVHKANIMKLSDGLFLDCCREVAKNYPDIEYNEIIVDNCAMQLVMNPHRFDVLVMENFYGDVLSDLCAGLVGGLGVVPGANLGEDACVFEAVHGSAPDIAGKGLANPTALLLSAVMMLEHIGEKPAADAIIKAVHQVYREGKALTKDMGGHASTEEFTAEIIRKIG